MNKDADLRRGTLKETIIELLLMAGCESVVLGVFPGKVVPEEAVLEMKANYSLPHESDPHVDEIIWVELPRDKSQDLVQLYVSSSVSDD